mmetsp:Transcript_3013/g.9263  ORF Transcript_3013/g.9263 Transcript_3013/m.9263 type:complete len:210 (-) Transcript_3013:7-636(-)
MPMAASYSPPPTAFCAFELAPCRHCLSGVSFAARALRWWTWISLQMRHPWLSVRMHSCWSKLSVPPTSRRGHGLRRLPCAMSLFSWIQRLPTRVVRRSSTLPSRMQRRWCCTVSSSAGSQRLALWQECPVAALPLESMPRRCALRLASCLLAIVLWMRLACSPRHALPSSTQLASNLAPLLHPRRWRLRCALITVWPHGHVQPQRRPSI